MMCDQFSDCAADSVATSARGWAPAFSQSPAWHGSLFFISPLTFLLAAPAMATTVFTAAASLFPIITQFRMLPGVTPSQLLDDQPAYKQGGHQRHGYQVLPHINVLRPGRQSP